MFNDINTKEMTMYKTDNLGKSVLYFIQFQEVISPIGFLKVVSVEKNGIEVPKRCLGIPRNSLIHRWTQIEEMLSHLYKYDHQNQDIWTAASKILLELKGFEESLTFNFLFEQFSLLLTSKFGRRYNKHVIL